MDGDGGAGAGAGGSAVGLTVFKAGGELLERPDAVCAAIAANPGQSVFVHGGGAQLDVEAAKAGLLSERVAGRRITSPALVDLAVATWRGTASVGWVLALARHGVRSVGLCGADAGCLRATRRPPVDVVDDDGALRRVDFGEVGDIASVDAGFLRALLPWAVPVVGPLALGDHGRLLNVNADTVAAEIAVALDADALVLWTGAPGLLADPTDPSSVLGVVDLAGIERALTSGSARGGMRPKLAAVEAALRRGVRSVVVGATRFVP